MLLKIRHRLTHLANILKSFENKMELYRTSSNKKKSSSGPLRFTISEEKAIKDFIILTLCQQARVLVK